MEVPPLRCTTPALTAIDVATLEDANAVDIALRSRQVRLDDLHDALRATPYRPGNQARLQVLLDSRDEPWSEAERRGHRLLREARVTGWRSNLPVRLGGALYYLDIAFPRARLAVEIDGRLHELDREVFESDRWRQNALVQAGWRVLRFTWSMLVNHPEQFVRDILHALRNDR
jgi:very-short-patch-repair endonuclease